MRVALVFVLAAGTLAASPLAAGAATTASPARTQITKALKQTLKSDFVPHTAAEIDAAITPVDINGDRIPDWQVDFKDLGTAWCGTGGCRYQLWLGRAKGGPVRVFDRRVRAHERKMQNGRIVFEFDFHGTYCGETGAEACPGIYAWSPKRGRMIALPIPGQVSAKASPIDRDQ
ncbi:MAG TPA: hypothetical protein VFV30_07585 [Novosphingobium sp.]|nr:hypothetical protein [Novosphingobium sp.]